MGPHRGRDRTVWAIVDVGCWWQQLYQGVQAVVRTCIICRNVNSHPLVTAHQRSREYDGPFRYLVNNFVGPMIPASSRGRKYMFTCACAWSGWYWAFPTEDDTAKTAARCLFYYIICDLAGYPVCLGSDSAFAFVEGVIKELAGFFGMHQVLGTAYHPQAQSVVERPHREYKRICRSFMEEYKDWDLQAQISVWSMIYNGQYTPYETITGLKPRWPI